ncbi:NUDIX domain-containing protein [Candidatus Uhrbacteria bacterium]|nr:NUDIX domain-containing protein [Candidatus Uhrbacteria bacterium]
MRFSRGETTYFSARRFWDAFALIRALLLEDGATVEDFLRLGPTLLPWTFGILTLARRWDANGESHVLVGIRSKELAGRHVGTVSFPGGLVKPGETIEQAARRQMKEECGIELTGMCPGYAIGHHPNAGSTTFVSVADAASSGDVTDSFEWKGGKALWAPVASVLKAIEGDTTAMVDVFRKAGHDVNEGAPIAPDAADPARILLKYVYPA